MNTPMTIFWSVVILIHAGLALPSGIREKSCKRFFIAIILSFVGIVLPVFIFSMSAFLVPEAKDCCHHGWLDCFHLTKLSLLPLVLWASAAFYAVEVLRVRNRQRVWIVLGFFVGAIVSGVSLIIGGISLGFNLHANGILYWYLVPLYVVVWYTVRTWHLMRTTSISPRTYFWTCLSSVPFWMVTILWARRYYALLPDHRSSCFIATSAMKGHASVVGPRFHVMHRGQLREANRQLYTLWSLEDEWMHCAPRSHSLFRKFYNIFGPVVAARIATPILSDMTFLAIKPVEIAARILLRCKNKGLPFGARYVDVNTHKQNLEQDKWMVG